MTRFLRITWPSVLMVLFACILAVVYIRPISDLDYGWQIRTGERILASGRMRQPEPFSYTIAGKDVPDHEWLYETTLALVWRYCGVAGLKCVRVALFAIPILIQAWQLRRRGVADDLLFLVILFTAIFLLQFERLRPLVCSTICLQLTAGWLHDHCRGRGKLNWKLPAVFLLWGNLHPAVLMGQGLLVGAVGWEWIAFRFRTRNATRNSELETRNSELRRRFWSLTLWSGLALAASFVAPAPIDRLLYPFAPELRHPAQRLFIEINPPWKFLFAQPWTRAAAVWAAGIVGVLLGVVAFRNWRKLRGWEWALLAGVTALAAVAVRALGDWLLISLAVIVPLVESVKLPTLRSALFRWQPGWCWVAIGLVAVVTVSPLRRVVPFQENQSWPHAAVDWIGDGKLPSAPPWKVFARFNDGAYLLWRLDGQAQVYTDTRGFYYPGELLEDSVYVPRCERNWRTRLERVLDRGTQYFLLPTQGPDGELWRRIEDLGGEAVYRDEHFVILKSEAVDFFLTLLRWSGEFWLGR